jgi:hypothetical protein
MTLRDFALEEGYFLMGRSPMGRSQDGGMQPWTELLRRGDVTTDPVPEPRVRRQGAWSRVNECVLMALGVSMDADSECEGSRIAAGDALS